MAINTLVAGGNQKTADTSSRLVRKHLFLVGFVILATGFFGWIQNRGGLVGGPISIPKMLWLTYTLLTFVVVPACLWRNRALSREIRMLFGVAFISFAIRGIIELYILYWTRNWQCIYGILHDLLTFALVVALGLRLPRDRTDKDQRALGFVWILLPSLLVECFMAWQFSKLASPGAGTYFASDDPHFQFVNNASWAAVVIGLPLLGWYLWRTRKDFEL